MTSLSKNARVAGLLHIVASVIGSAKCRSPARCGETLQHFDQRLGSEGVERPPGAEADDRDLFAGFGDLFALACLHTGKVGPVGITSAQANSALATRGAPIIPGGSARFFF
jgi:hypothetical protein